MCDVVDDVIRKVLDVAVKIVDHDDVVDDDVDD